MKLHRSLPVIVVLLVACLRAVGQTTETYSFTNLTQTVPDGNTAGMSDRRMVSSAIANISALRVKLHVAGEFNGDLYCYVRHVNGGITNFCVLLNRPGRAAIRPSGYDDAGMNVTFDDAATNGDIHTYRALAAPPPGTPLTGTWRPDGRAVDPETVTEASPSITALSSFNGANPNGEWTLYLADLESGGTHRLMKWELEVTGAVVPLVTWLAPADFVYGTALGVAQLNASSPVLGSFSYDPPPGTVLNAGATQVLSMTFTPSDLANYVPATTHVSINVLRKDLSIAAVSASKVCGAALPVLAAAYSGFVNGDTAASLDTPAALATTATATSRAGAYPITVGGATDANYAITFVDGNLTITPAGTIGTVSTSANPAPPGQLVTFTLQVSVVAPGAGTPTGTVQFKVDGASAGSPSPLTGGVASQGLATLVAGFHTFTAEYAGDVNFLGTTNTLAQAQLINTTPVAGTDTIERNVTNGSKVLLTTLLTNDLDGDGDAIHLLSIGATSANGGIVTLNGAWVLYTPPAGFTNNDSFTYTIADSYNAVATGTVLVTIKTDTVPSANLLITDLRNGSYLLRFDGIPGKTYRLEYAEDVNLRNWQTLGSSSADPFGAFEFMDTPPSGSPLRYYRSVYP